MTREASTAELMQQVGHCLAAWSGVEYNMTRLFLVIHDADRPPAWQPLQAAYECVRSFEVRLDMLHQSIVHNDRISTVFRDAWNPLRNKMTKMARRRAQVAHFSTVENQDGKGNFAQIRLAPFPTMTGWMSGTAPQPLTADQLNRRVEVFTCLALRLDDLAQYIERERGRRAASLPPITDPLRLLHRKADPSPKGP